MSLLEEAKQFFGLTPYDDVRDDAYFDEPRYESEGSAAYAPSYEQSERGAYRADSLRHSYADAPRYEPRIVVVSPTRYAEAVKIGEPFRDGDAVTFELTGTEHRVAKRIIDFAAGLCFAVEGAMHNLTASADTDRRVFAIVPREANITVAELRRAAGLPR